MINRSCLTILTIAGVQAAATAATACTACMGDPNSAMTQGMNMAIWVLLGVTGTVFSGLGAFVVLLRRRQRRFAASGIDELWREGLRKRHD